ncbi:GNAT family N-acetyltransferase [Pseudobacteroides cellulosolvens]|uniref:GCN5-related N-acetyltransferase n=1 Tax=Pseudobacteroides cellulosolvens ATCC 35603 = DSM 2933 TaxID=398512 RepID=A0A0L6JMY3_9FIRM|nr:GNAT family N-acetyltransferase [Pseudobacteroides cellulosolvens]KNY27176.1 GCN5-related N-acetyltransferase [Pseudobacteroides cellulosolvens ATCC 35603 = DSM 2933]
MIIMETERLIIRNFRVDDWEDLYEYLSQKDVLKYEPENESDEEECKKKAIERSQSNIFWAVCLKDSNKMIGHIYFNQTGPVDFLTWEIGYIFNPKYYGKGYATEASQRILQFGFEELNAHRIIGMCNPENTASWKLLERLSMRLEGHHKKKAFFRRREDGEPIWHDAYQYAMLAEEWISRNL